MFAYCFKHIGASVLTARNLYLVEHNAINLENMSRWRVSLDVVMHYLVFEVVEQPHFSMATLFEDLAERFLPKAFIFLWRVISLR